MACFDALCAAVRLALVSSSSNLQGERSVSVFKALSAIFGPARTRESTRLCPTLAADDRQAPAMPDVIDFGPPLIVRLADLRKARP